MIKGALILATGYALGYAHAMAQVPELREFAQAMKAEWKKAGIDPDNTIEGETSS